MEKRKLMCVGNLVLYILQLNRFGKKRHRVISVSEQNELIIK